MIRIPSTLATFATATWLLTLALSLTANDRVIVVSSAGDRSTGLDLSAVGEIFQASNDLQHFEQQLNDPDLLLNNLDLNEDGQVDFLRVLEEETDSGRLIVIQAILGENTFTDVAYIDIQQERSGRYQVQIRGEPTLYGSRTFYLPRHETVSWPIVVDLWAPSYSFYHSPYHWDHYPSWYRPSACVRVGFYRSRIAYRYASPTFHFSYNAGFRGYHRPHHRTHHSYRDYQRSRKDHYRPYDRSSNRYQSDRSGIRYPSPRIARPRTDSDRSHRDFSGKPRESTQERNERLRPSPERRPENERNHLRKERMERRPDNASQRILPRVDDRVRERIEPRNPTPARPRIEGKNRHFQAPTPSRPTPRVAPQPSRPTPPTVRESRAPSLPGRSFENRGASERQIQPPSRTTAPPRPVRHSEPSRPVR